MTDHLPKNQQPGISATPPEHLLVAALDLTPTDAAGARGALEELRTLVRHELDRELADPSHETGELGFDPHHLDYDLEVTLGISHGGYQHLGASPEEIPVDLQPMPADMLDSSGATGQAVMAGEGDLVLHVTSDDIYVAEHVLHRIEVELSASVTIRWVQSGDQRYTTSQLGQGKNKKESRAIIGFLDGTHNLDLTQEADRELVFVNHQNANYPPIPSEASSSPYGNPQAVFPPELNLRPPPTVPEPAALDGGSYMAVEAFVIKMHDFDGAGRAAQEAAIGTLKDTGAALPTQDLHSHVLKANPHRNADDEARRFLRRGYPLVRVEAGQLIRGLLFVAFGRTLSTQVEFVQRGWLNNPNFPDPNNPGKDTLLANYVEPRLLAGGFYYVPPLAHPGDGASWVTPQGASASSPTPSDTAAPSST